jgi:hypothetical protein
MGRVHHYELVALYAGTATDKLLTARRTADFSTEKSIFKIEVFACKKPA